MSEYLRQFNGDVHTKNDLIEFAMAVINEEALQMMYDRKDVAHIADAKILIEKIFDKLETTYGVQPREKEVTNQAK